MPERKLLSHNIQKIVFQGSESLKHEKFCLGWCCKKNSIRDQVKQKHYEKSVINPLIPETLQKRHQCIGRIKKHK